MTTENKKSQFYRNKKAFHIDHVDVNKILVNLIRPLCLRLPQVTGYAKKFNENAAISFKVNNRQLLKNYNKIWEKVEKLLKINFESNPAYGDNDKYIKTKGKTHADNMITNSHNKKMPKEKAPCKFLSIIMLDSVIKANKMLKVLLSNTLRRMQIYTRKDKNWEPVWSWFRKSESDSESNDETESDIDNDEYEE